MARSTFDINFYCSPSKVSKKTGMAPIYISIIVNGKRELFPLPQKCKPEEFAKSMSSRKPNPIKEYCNTIVTRLDSYKLELLQSGKELSAKNLREFFERGGVMKVYTLDDLFTEYLQILHARIGVSLKREVYVKYQRAMRYFKEVNHLSGDEPITDVNRQHILTFQTELLKDFKKSTGAGYQAKIRAVFKYGFESGKVKTYLYSNLHIDKGAAGENIVFLTEEELERVKRKVFATTRMKNTRDIFLFQCYSGLAYIDLKTLRREDFKVTDDGRYYIKKKRAKTGQEFVTVLLKDAAQIAILYHFELPVKSNQKYNEYLKDLAELCELYNPDGTLKNLTTHVARHTFVMYLLNKHIPHDTIGKMCGWAEGESRRMLKVYGKLLDKTVFEDTKELDTERDKLGRHLMELLTQH